jgi:hypothetical protein
MKTTSVYVSLKLEQTRTLKMWVKYKSAGEKDLAQSNIIFWLMTGVSTQCTPRTRKDFQFVWQ